MKILHITTVDIGGAYKAAYRLHESMTLNGLDSQILVRTRRHSDGRTEEVFRNPVQAFVSKGKNGINKIYARGMIANDKFGTDVSKHSLVCEADVIVLHWINSFLSYESILRLGKLGKHIVWVMHDMWPFTGGCHYDDYCGRFEKRCGNCPMIRGEKEMDLSRKNFLDKMDMMRRVDITMAGPSQWIVGQAQKSEILSDKKICYMPNMLNTSVYRPVADKEKLRKRYGISGGKKVVLFGAADNGTENEKKGFRYLREAFLYLAPEKYQLMIFGNAGMNLGLPDELEIIRMGYVSDESKLIELYNLADVLANPSNQEVFGYTVCEAMACGTPVVGFPVGGIAEQITHEVNGYLARFHDAEDLARGIELDRKSTRLNSSHMA